MASPWERIYANAQTGSSEIRKYSAPWNLLEDVIAKQGLNAEAHDRIMKVARTIVDQAGAKVPTSLSRSCSARSTGPSGHKDAI